MHSEWKRIGTYGTVGLELVAATLLCLFAGKWVDAKLGTDPWFALGGLILGAATGFRNLWRVAKRAEKELDAQDESERSLRRRYHEQDREPPLDRDAGSSSLPGPKSSRDDARDGAPDDSE